MRVTRVSDHFIVCIWPYTCDVMWGKRACQRRWKNPHSGLGNFSKRQEALDYGIYLDRFLGGCSCASKLLPIFLSGDCVRGSHTHKCRMVMVAARWHESHAPPTTTVRAYIIISDVKVTIFHRVAVTCSGLKSKAFTYDTRACYPGL